MSDVHVYVNIKKLVSVCKKKEPVRTIDDD